MHFQKSIRQFIKTEKKLSLKNRILLTEIYQKIADNTLGCDCPMECDSTTYYFENEVLESGVALAEGAVYRFSNVTPNWDALVTILEFHR